jgi:hypothetical protein
LAEFVAVEPFERVGAFLEMQDWQQYVEMPTPWRRPRTRPRPRCSNPPTCSNVGVVTSRTVFEFDESGKIRHPDVSVQQAR